MEDTTKQQIIKLEKQLKLQQEKINYKHFSIYEFTFLILFIFSLYLSLVL